MPPSRPVARMGGIRNPAIRKTVPAQKTPARMWTKRRMMGMVPSSMRIGSRWPLWLNMEYGGRVQCKQRRAVGAGLAGLSTAPAGLVTSADAHGWFCTADESIMADITGVIRVDRREIEISRPEKVLFPD